MRSRATSLVVLVGFFAVAAGGLTAHARPGVGAQVPHKAIKTASDLPALSYPVAGSATDAIRSEEVFRPIGEKLRRDIDTLLRDFTVEDQSTLRGLHDTLLTLDLLENRAEEARKEIAIVRQLEDKPAAKLMSGLVQEALLDSGGTKPDPTAFFRAYSAALNRLPWDVVDDLAKRQKAGFENLTEPLLANLAEARYGGAIRTNGQLNLAGVQALATMRYSLAMRIPVRDKAIEALATYIGAHNALKPNIWPARSVTLDAAAKAKPVVIGIWDTGVDRSVFRGQLATDGPVPGFAIDGNPTQGELPVLDARQKERWPQMLSLLKGSLDRQAAVETPDAAAFLEQIRTNKPEDMQALRASIRIAGSYIHGTHVAGIALEGNPFGRLAVVRTDEHPERVPPPALTLAGLTKFAAGAGELTAYLRKQGARVVNMSWVVTLGGLEQNLQANGVGANPAERRKMAQEMFGALRDGLHKALASTPEILYVAGAGNTDRNTTFDEDMWASMTDLPNLMVAGAVDQAGNEAPFTCFGPAVTVYSNGFQVESFIPGGGRMKDSGTSMAAPNVTNLAAKLIALDSSLTPADVVKLVRDGSDLSADGRFRLINPRRSVELLQARMRAVPPTPPVAPVRPVTDTLHGVAVTDPYRWMEDGGQEFTDWLKAQDAYTRAVLERIPGRQKIATELRAVESDRGVGVTQPRRVGNRYFFRKRNFAADEGGPKLYVRDATTGTERVLVDPVDIRGGNRPWAIQEYAVSPDGRYLAYIATAGGSNVGILRVMEVATARTLPDTIDRVFYPGRLSWQPDSRAFSFTRVRALSPGAPPKDVQKCPTTFLHVVGTGPDSDRPLVGCDITARIPIAENQWGGVTFSTASRYALGWVVLDSARTALAFYTAPVETLSSKDIPWRRLASADDQVTEVVLRGDTAYLRTGHGAPRGKVVRTSVLHPDVARADVVVAQSEAVIATLEPTAMPQSALYLAKDALYVRMRAAGIGRLLRVPFDTSGGTAVPLPFAGSVRQASARPEDAGITFVLDSWTRAPRVYAFDPESDTVRDTGLAPNNPAERREFEVSEVKARSADGTLVPLTILGSADLKKDHSHPTLLEGYGAYGVVTESDPAFTPGLIPWLQRGGLSARCHVRGGGDYGEEWHRAGQGRNKANTISDFIACAEYLVTQGYTTPARLAGIGRSAGGLTIGGAITRRPDLFAVAFPVAAVSDLLRFEFGKQLDQAREFGTVTDPDDFRAMLAVSPYHNITPGTRYPAVLAMTAINDENVAPWHVGKLVARLQAATTSGKPVLLRVDWDAGHFSAGIPLADRYSFMLWQMGIAEFQPTSDK